MAIQPIDLQTLFTQVDKVGKNQSALREGQQIQEALQQVQSQKKLEENVQSVNEAQEMGEETDKIKDDSRRGSAYGGTNQGGAKDEDESETEKETREFIRDPALGRNIDISG